MGLDYFKDTLFDLLNDCDSMDVSDIEVNESTNIITVSMTDGSIFEAEGRRAEQPAHCQDRGRGCI